MTSPTSIRDCMHRNPLTITGSAPLVKAIELLVEFKLTGLTVVDDEAQSEDNDWIASGRFLPPFTMMVVPSTSGCSRQ